VGQAGCRNDIALFSNPVTPGVWHHLAGTWDGISMKFYVDGNLVGSFLPPIGAHTFDPFDRMLIGAYWDKNSGGPVGFFPGDVAEVGVWDHARNATEIRESLCIARSGTEAGLIGLWHLDEGTGQTVFDATSNHNNGTLGSNGSQAGDAADPAWVGSAVRPCHGDATPPVLSLPSDITVDATSPAGAVVAYSASATDDVDPAPVVACAPQTGSTFPIGTTTVICSGADRTGNMAGGTFQVRVKGAGEQIDDLIALVASLGTPPGTENSLLTKLASACGSLQAFINETAAQSGKKLTSAQADQLIASAIRIRAVLGCGP
jgi:hypothetical protein